MGDQFKLSLVVCHQYDGGPVEWENQSLFVASGALVNHVDFSRDACKSFKIAKSEVISFSISPCRRFMAILESREYLLIASVATGAILCRSNLRSKKAQSPLTVAWLPCGTKLIVTRGDICQLYHVPMKEPSYNPIRLLRTYKGTYGTVRHSHFTPEAELMVLGGDDAKIRLYPIPNIKRFNKITTLIGLRSQVRGCWLGGETGLDVIGIDQSGMVAMWQQDYMRSELDFDLETSPRFFAPSLLKRLRQKAQADLEKMEDGDDDADEVVDSSSSDEEDDEDDDETVVKYRRTYKDFINQKGQRAVPLTAADYHHKSRMLAVGHSNGDFALFEVHWAADAAAQGSLIEMQRLSMDGWDGAIGQLRLSPRGDWLAIGGEHGGLTVWEWQSQNYVMEQKTQGHQVQCASYSPCGTKLITGASDGACKVWSALTGFCIVTFKNHTAPVTGVTWLRSGLAFASAAKDGTVRVYDLRRYRNFRTLTTPRAQRLAAVSCDAGGELVAAAGGDSGSIFVWSIRTGRLLDEFANHEASCVRVAFSPIASRLLSCSWDGSAVITDFANQEQIERETLENSSDMLDAVWRPDGQQIASATLNGKIIFWNPRDAQVQGEIDCTRDIRIGRSKTQMVSAKNLANDAGWRHLAYTADGEFLIAAGESYVACMYSIKARHVIARFTITVNQRLDGLEEFLDKKSTMTEFGALADIAMDDNVNLAGAKKRDRSQRAFGDVIKCTAITTSPTGTEFALATTEGVSIYSKDSTNFSPIGLTESITPVNLLKSLDSKLYGDAMVMALSLSETQLMRRTFESIPLNEIQLLASTMPPAYAIAALTFVSGELATTRHAELYVTWCVRLLSLISKKPQLKRKAKAAARLAARAVRTHREKMLSSGYANTSLIAYMKVQHQMRQREKENEVEEGDEANEQKMEEKNEDNEWNAEEPSFMET